jgi:microcystin-dependent protein
MSDQYVGEIRMFGGNFAPINWALCNGQLLAISEYEVLYTLLGTTYGGDGQTTFALPDLRGRVPLHQGPGFNLGQASGVESVTLLSNQMPAHTHSFISSQGAPNSDSPANAFPATVNAEIYGEDQPLLAYNPQKVSSFGGSQPHENLQPSTCLTFIIATAGIFPSQG